MSGEKKVHIYQRLAHVVNQYIGMMEQKVTIKDRKVQIMKNKNCMGCGSKNTVDELGWCDNCGGAALEENWEVKDIDDEDE